MMNKITAEDFLAQMKADGVAGKVNEANELHADLVEQYISHNSPVKVGGIYTIEDVGVRNDLSYYKKKGRGFIVNSLEINYLPNGYPLIIAVGDVVTSGYCRRVPEDSEGTFRVIVHGAMSVVTLAKYVDKERKDGKKGRRV